MATFLKHFCVPDFCKFIFKGTFNVIARNDITVSKT